MDEPAAPATDATPPDATPTNTTPPAACTEASAATTSPGDAPVVIVGGGFAGLYTALALVAGGSHPPVLLIEPRDHFLFLPLLYEVLSGELRRWEVAPPLADLLAHQGVAWLQDRVVRIDSDRQQLVTATGRQLTYSQLVLACGGQSDSSGVPGAEQHALGFRSLADCDRLLQCLRTLKDQPRPLQRLAIVGAGPSGVELACKLADLTSADTVVELIEQGAQALPQARAFNREQALLALERRDVRLRTHTEVKAVGSDHLLLQSRASNTDSRTPPPPERLPVAAVIWTAGQRFQPPALTPPAPAAPRGRLRCEADLRLEGHDRIFVAGDLAACSHDADGPLPSTAQVAFQQATCLAANLRRAIAGQPLEPFHWQDLGEMLSLGVGEASVTGSGVTLAGRAAATVRRLAYLTRLPGRAHQLRVAAGWLADALP